MAEEMISRFGSLGEKSGKNKMICQLDTIYTESLNSNNTVQIKKVGYIFACVYFLCMVILHICKCTSCMANAFLGQKRIQNVLL